MVNLFKLFIDLYYCVIDLVRIKLTNSSDINRVPSSCLILPILDALLAACEQSRMCFTNFYSFVRVCVCLGNQTVSNIGAVARVPSELQNVQLLGLDTCLDTRRTHTHTHTYTHTEFTQSLNGTYIRLL